MITVTAPRSTVLWWLLSAVPLSVACGGSGSPTDPPQTVTVVFRNRAVPGPAGEVAAVTRDPAVKAKVAAQLALPEPQRTLHLHGRLARGDGGHNGPWSWHLVVDGWDLVELSIELCDGTPEMVQTDIDHWVDSVGEFCPWESYVAAQRG